jgi:phosphoribosylglycinamide formyltransferase-1
MSGPLSFVILASGTGTNARALIEHARINPARLEVKALISDRAEIPALAMAASLGVPTHIVNHRDEGPMLALLNKYTPRWALLAGYKRLVGPGFLGFFQDAGFFRVMNVHPSLLPAYPGLGGYERAFQDGVLKSGVTVHLVDSGLDTGMPILQESFAREAGDTLEDFVKRGQKIEHKIYCRALDMAAAGQVIGAKGKA